MINEDVPYWVVGMACFAFGMAAAMILEMVLVKYIGDGVK